MQLKLEKLLRMPEGGWEGEKETQDPELSDLVCYIKIYSFLFFFFFFRNIFFHYYYQ